MRALESLLFAAGFLRFSGIFWLKGLNIVGRLPSALRLFTLSRKEVKGAGREAAPGKCLQK
ncbi:hypothetical protein PTH_2471 [Pelotomaculum thermopropionicum SI]|uniref:Uncharacterized protein n=1 Tax=Pelotomaculum thermopropionicum (strain DSM 13744 / JCM 10971 / SI) TaxID=370438 RepID=A5CZC1_PELTS|nr:hypothetical protein PTH_2471 [Pelotomaculum thermopropionicum SI]